MLNVVKLLLAALFFLLASPAFAQSTEPVWERFYGSGAANPDDRAHDAVADAEGHLYVTGSSTVAGTRADFLTVKLDAEGEVVWSARYDEGLADIARTITLGPDGAVYVSGSSWDGASSSIGVVTVSYDAGGRERWASRFKGDGRDVSLAAAGDSSLYVGAPYDAGGAARYKLIKYGAGGEELWQADLPMDGLLASPSSAIHLDADGNVYVGGRSSGAFALWKHDPNGNELWAVTRDGGGDADYRFLTQMTVDADGNAYLTGEVEVGSGADHGLLAKFDAQGVLLWEHYDAEIETGLAVEVDPTGGVYVGGRPQPTSEFGMAVRKFSEEGAPEWLAREEDLAYYGIRLIARPEGGVFVVQSEPELDGYQKHFVIAYNGDGEWRAREDYFYRGVSARPHLAFSGDGLFLAGDRAGGTGDADLFAVRYSIGSSEYHFLDEAWAITYNAEGRNNAERVHSVKALEGGGLIVGATSLSAETGPDLLFQKYAADGALVWTTRVDAESRETLVDFAVDAAGAVYALGNYERGEPLTGIEWGFVVAKLNPQGDVLWSEPRRVYLYTGPDEPRPRWREPSLKYGPPRSNYYAQRIVPYAEGDALVLWSDNVSKFHLDRYGGDGSVRWAVEDSAAYSAGPHNPANLATDAAGHAYTLWPGPDGRGYRITKRSADGERVWTSPFPSQQGDQVTARALRARPNGEVYVGGSVVNSSREACVLAKLDRDGSLLWEATTARGYVRSDRSVAVDAAGNAFLSCRNGVTKYDAEGREQWSYALDGEGHWAEDLVADERDRVAFIGVERRRTYQPRLLDAEGDLQWSASESELRLSAMDVDGDGFLYAAGSHQGELRVLKFGTGTSVSAEEAPAVPGALTLEQNHPNPFSGATEIAYALPAPSDVRLGVYDLLGRRVATLAEGGRPAGTHRAAFDAGGRLASGVYFYRLEAGGQVQTRRMVVAR